MDQPQPDFSQFLDIACPLTVCDREGIILYMNPASCRQFDKDGGASLIGKNLFDCHNPNSVAMMKQMMEEDRANTYSVEKAGKKKLIRQEPWYRTDQEGKRVVGGLLEMSIEMPEGMRHILRG